MGVFENIVSLGYQPLKVSDRVFVRVGALRIFVEGGLIHIDIGIGVGAGFGVIPVEFCVSKLTLIVIIRPVGTKGFHEAGFMVVRTAISGKTMAPMKGGVAPRIARGALGAKEGGLRSMGRHGIGVEGCRIKFSAGGGSMRRFDGW
jgi:hypothetical protein